MCLQEKLQSFILDLNKFKFSHPIIFGKWLSYISEQTTNYTLLEKIIEGNKMIIALHSGVCDLSLQDYNRVLIYKLSIVDLM